MIVWIIGRRLWLGGVLIVSPVPLLFLYYEGEDEERRG